MGQKVNPHGMRVGVIKDWDSRWFVSDEKFGDTLVSDDTQHLMALTLTQHQYGPNPNTTSFGGP